MTSNWKQVVVGPSKSLRETIRIIDNAALQIALVVNEHGRLIGTVTDGDVRRGILSGIDLESQTSEIMNRSPIKVYEGEEQDKILFLMKTMSIQQIPLVNHENELVGLTTLNQLLQKTPRRENIAVLMAGGLGSRLGELTQDCPKPLLKIGGIPILETILKSLIEKGFYKFYVSVNYHAEMVKEYFGDGAKWNCSVSYLHEKTRLGTAGALSLLPETPTKPMIVMNGDIMTQINFASLLDFHDRHQSDATMCIREYNHTIPYGVVELSGNHIVNIKEKPVEKVYVSAGIYVLCPKTLKLIPKGEFYDMPTLFQRVMKQKGVVAGFPIHEYWLDIGRKEDFYRAQDDYINLFNYEQ